MWNFQKIRLEKLLLGSYLVSIAEIVNSVQHIGTGALLIVNNYILGLIWGNDSIYLFGSDSKDENGNLSRSGTAVLLKFDTLYSLENYIPSLYYNATRGLRTFKYKLLRLTALSMSRMPLNAN